jgi:N-acetyl-anhydromuramyl-L-alanine amidase AmpD
MLSALATPIQNPRLGAVRPVRAIAIHTTGSGLPAQALSVNQDPLEAAIAYYRVNYSPTYVIAWDGRIAAIYGDELAKTSHIGVEADEFGPIRDGTWRSLVSPETVRRWEARWGRGRNPLDLTGGALPNDVVLGIEMIPMTDGTHAWAVPYRTGLRFTAAQHRAARALVADIRRRHGVRTPLYGHEDLNPIRRSDAGGGWDPGRLRGRPYVDMAAIDGRLSPVVVGAAIAAGVLLVLATR